MKRYALRTLVCPFSQSELSLVSFEETPVTLTPEDAERLRLLGVEPSEASSAVKEGVLYSERSGKWFPVVNYTPILLDFPTGLHEKFRERHASETDILRNYSMADGSPREGELFVQKTFTREWDLMTDLDALSFGLTPEMRDAFISLELDWPPRLLERGPLKLLEVGCGSGFETASLYRVTRGMIFGFDLNLSLVRKGHQLSANPFVNNSVCSLFRLPLRPRSFPLVYSSGVLHHTYSTRAAFDVIEQFRADDGVIYIWVYAFEDYVMSIRHQGRYLSESLFRARIARLPDFWQNVVVKLLARRHYRRYVGKKYQKYGGRLNPEKWTRKDSEHSVRDTWTALYAHRHSFKEVGMWFQEKGLRFEFIDARAYLEKMGVALIGIGIRGASQAYFDRLAREEPPAPSGG
jgi:uncharacterized protein YbaR (Trm112 family)/ubiquinone/menaquinone biosynthesis C-methylase UbiE